MVAKSLELPISLNQKMLNFKTIVYNQIYRQEITIINDSQKQSKIEVVQDYTTREYFYFNTNIIVVDG